MLFNKNDNGDDEIAKLASWTAGHEFKHLEESVILAQYWVEFILGKDVSASLEKFYHSENYEVPATEEDKQKTKAVELLQRVLLNRAYQLYAPKGMVHFDNTGISVKWGEEYRPARDEMPVFLKSLENSAFTFLNQLISHMESNIAYFPEWADGEVRPVELWEYGQ